MALAVHIKDKYNYLKITKIVFDFNKNTTGIFVDEYKIMGNKHKKLVNRDKQYYMKNNGIMDVKSCYVMLNNFLYNKYNGNIIIEDV